MFTDKRGRAIRKLGDCLVGFPSISFHPSVTKADSRRGHYAWRVIMAEFPVHPAKVTSILQSKTPLCPGPGCDGKMEPDSRMRSLTGLGLCALVCPVCRHSGYRSLEGIRLLFATTHEYVCSYGPSIQSLTVVFSGASLASLRNKGLCPIQSALFAAHWALLCGQLVGVLCVFPESPAFVNCYTYFQREIVSDFSVHSTDLLR